jgi:hypothetical protein
MDYAFPGRSAFAELRRALPVAAAVLFVAALALPMWEISVDAVQYPTRSLQLQLYAYPHITGDYVEMARLNHYVGFYYPDPVYWQPNYDPHPNAIAVPEWSFGPVAFVAVSLCSLFVALAPDVRRLKRGLLAQFAGTALVFAVLLADIQYRLYQAGHSLDPGAPVMGVDGFTPPIWGSYQIANITSRSRFGLGAYVAGVAVVLLAVAFHYRDRATTFGDRRDGAVARLGLGGDDDDSPSGEDRPTGDDPTRR